MTILDAKTDEEVEDLSFVAKECSILGNVLLFDKNKLLTLTYNGSKTSSFVNEFNIDSEKQISNLDFSSLFGIPKSPYKLRKFAKQALHCNGTIRRSKNFVHHWNQFN